MSGENRWAKKPPSLDVWLKEAKKDPQALKAGMFLVHNGTVRETPKALVRQGTDDGTKVIGMDFTYDEEKVGQAVAEALKLKGICCVKAWLNRGQLQVGDDIMYLLVGGDIRPNVIGALEFLLEKIKSECVSEIELKA